MFLNDMIVLRPVVFFVILAGVVLVPPSVVLNYWHTRTGTMEKEVRLFTQKLHQEILSGVQVKADLLSPLHSSTTNFARILSSYVNATQLSITNIESQVAPLLFQAFSTIPYLSQISYIRRDGLLFSYYNQGNQQPIAVYTNTSLISVDKELSAADFNFTCYSQPANRDTGKLYGAVTSNPPSTLLIPSILEVALESTDGNSSLVPSWIDIEDLLFLNTAVMDGRGAISLGFEAKAIVQSLSGSISDDGSLFLGTKDGQVLLSDVKIPNTRIVIDGNNSVALQLLNQNGDQVGDIAGSLTCQANDGTLQPTTITISETKYDAYCSQLEILGVELVFVLAMPVEGPERSLRKHFNESYQYLLGAICLIFLLTALFVILIVVASERVTELHTALMKQMDATAQAERKCIKKSTNYANASHDVRASLAGITGLIEICQTQVDRGSDLEENIIQIKTCSLDLLGILNNILDRSKLEAGKVTLEEEEFEMSKLLEDVADLFHVVGMKKGVDVVLDLSDGSVNKFDHVRGDRKKLKQILLNIVSNAVKFTSEGYVSIRAYARKPSAGILNSTRKGPLSWLSCFFFQKNEAFTRYEATVIDIQKDENCMEFVFEVDDTGVGIPKDKQDTVFENYAQIKETSAGKEGTGLGLGIVQSLVRLMGGEIHIVDKEVGKKGTCFKFNTYLPVCETDQRASSAREQFDDIESNVGAYMSSGESYSAQNIQFSSPNIEGSHVVLFIQNEERRKVCKRFMERQRIKVSVVRNCEELSSTLKRLRHRRVVSLNSSSKKSDALQSIAGSRSSSTRSKKEVPLSSLDGIDQEMPPTHRRTSTSRSVVPSFILIVIDTNGGPFHELSRAVAEFRKNISTGSNRVVWLDRPGYGNFQQQGLNEDKLPPGDIIISKPFHGSRLYLVQKLLPEFGGELPREMPEAIPPYITISSATNNAVGEASTTSQPRPITSTSFVINLPPQNVEIKEVDKLLSRKKVLLVDDEPMQQKIGTLVLSKLGAITEICTNGQEALQTVTKGLHDQKTSGAAHVLPFDYIFMDCQMLVMGGTEATRKIREEEAKYGVHIPIFAVSADTDGPEIELMKAAGVDYNLSKPLHAEKIEEAIKFFEDNYS